MTFEGIRAEQLENYLEPKSRSNVYSRVRLEVKEGLLEASVRLLEQLAASGRSFDILASDHHPSLWNKKVVDRQFVFFSRGKQEREDIERLVDHDRSLASTLMDPTPFFKYAFLSLCVSGGGFEIAVKLHFRAWVDRDNFLVRIGDPEEREAFLDLFAGLPEEYAFGLEGGPAFPVAEMDGTRLEEVLAAFRENEGMLSCGLIVDPDSCEELGPDIMDVASVAFMLLSPIYDALSWSEEEDLITLSERTQAIDARKQAVAAEHRQEREAFETRQRERREEQARRYEEQRAEKLEQQVYRQEVRRAAARRAAEQEAQREAEEREVARRAAEHKARPPVERKPARQRPASRDEGPFEVKPGVRVEIGSGVLSGKWGVVQEIDNRGQAKVVLGSLVARVPASDLRAPARRRRR
jgi:hypothetical protein